MKRKEMTVRFRKISSSSGGGLVDSMPSSALAGRSEKPM
jgi:hypothetical protein